MTRVSRVRHSSRDSGSEPQTPVRRGAPPREACLAGQRRRLNPSDAEISAGSRLRVLVCPEATERAGRLCAPAPRSRGDAIGEHRADTRDRRGDDARGPARGSPVRDPPRDRGPGRHARAGARLPARARPPADRGRAGPREDAHREDDRQRARRHLPARPVHARPRALGPRRHAHLPRRLGHLRHGAGARLLQLPARRRDQPRARQGAVGAARGHAGAPGHDRAHDARRARPVPRHGDAEPDRVRGDVPAAGGAGRPLHAQDPGRLPRARRGAHRRAALARRPARAPLGARARRSARAAAQGARTSTSTPPP